MIPPIDPKLVHSLDLIAAADDEAAEAGSIFPGMSRPITRRFTFLKFTKDASQLETIFKSLHVRMSLKRKLPESLTAGSKRATSPPPEALIAAIEAEAQASNAPKTPPREIQSGCPASNFLLTVSPQQYKPIASENLLQCDLAATPKEQWSKR